MIPSLAEEENEKLAWKSAKPERLIFTSTAGDRRPKQAWCFFFRSSGLSNKQVQSLREESDADRGIVVGDFNDTYSNLSLKMAVIIS